MAERKPMTTFNRATLAKVLEILDSSHAGAEADVSTPVYPE